MQSSIVKDILFYLLLLLFTLPVLLFAQGTTKVTAGRIFPGEIDAVGFYLTEKTNIKISGTAANFDSWDEDDIFYCWILKTSTREVVWNLLDDFDYDEDGLFDFNARISLDKGNYEVYYTGNRNYDQDKPSLGQIIGRIFRPGSHSFKKSKVGSLYVDIEAPETKLIPVDAEELTSEVTSNAAVAILRTGNYEHIQKNFALKDETTFNIYAIGEGMGKYLYDYGWIENVKNFERVWTMNMRNSDYAGGGRKNRLVEDKITLPAGSYTVNYVTDDSHSYQEWNVMPPNDPQFWGITLFPSSDKDAANLIPFDEEDLPKPIVDLTRIGNNEYVSQGFELKESMRLRVYCLGEGISKNYMADYGWILNAETRKTVWEMTGRKTDYAGGASKNRVIDEVVDFDKGKYIAYYSTDDSHSYNDWNAAPPFDRGKWGISIWTVNGNTDSKIKLFNEENFVRQNLIAEILHVRDDQRLSRPFSLDKDTKIKIIAIGEGTRNGMDDYGWIENSSGVPVWEMTFKKTEHAGGASKNRKFVGSIILPEGNYKLFYKSDGSHSYKDWNSYPPKDEEHYGITLLYDK